MRDDAGKAARLRAILDETPVEQAQNPISDDRERAQVGNGGNSSPPPPRLPPASNGGGSGSLEPRIAKLEAQMENVRDELKKLASLPETLGRLEERLKALPDKDWVGTKMRNWVGGGVAFLTLVTIVAKFVHLG